jgi:hypothetical protein
MYKWLIFSSLTSILLIILLHYFYNYLLENFTQPKIIDIVDETSKQYRDIIDKLGTCNEGISSSTEEDLGFFLQNELNKTN